MDGQQTTALVDTGATVSTISDAYCKQKGIEIRPLDQLVRISGTGGFPVPYVGYAEVQLQMLRIPDYEEMVVMLVIPDHSPYDERVPVQVGTRIIHKVFSQIDPEKLRDLDIAWKAVYMSTMLSNAAGEIGRASCRERV